MHDEGRSAGYVPPNLFLFLFFFWSVRVQSRIHVNFFFPHERWRLSPVFALIIVNHEFSRIVCVNREVVNIFES